jgi:photosystem II stability/assembly factor-like uncharacterized protein
MRTMPSLGGFAGALVIVGTLVLVGSSAAAPSRGGRSASRQLWAEQSLTGTHVFTGQVPLAVAGRKAGYLRPHAPGSELRLNFGLPLRNKAALDRLIAREAKTHRYVSRARLYARFSPPQAQLNALGSWLTAHGFRITHVGRDRLSIAAAASTATVQKTLRVQIKDFARPGFMFRGLKIAPFAFYSNTTAPRLPARFGVQSISGLTNIDRFFTDYQLAHHGQKQPFVRSGGYFPSDLRSMYDITGHGFDGTGQTLGFTLWTAAERQQAMTTFANNTGDQLITIDPNCVASGNSPTVPSSCTTQTVAADHLLFILENGNLDNNFGSNVETALDIEAAHGIATHAGLKYYASDCASTTPPGSGLSNAGCNGSDVGLEETLEDAANDPALHSVSNSWAFGGEAEWGAADPFLLASENSLAIGAAAGTTFYFSTGDSGTYQSGYPSDSPHVVGVGGTSMYSTATNGQLSTSTTWSGGGSWCSNVFARPAWQTGAGVAANAPCPGRVIPDVSAVADPNTGVRFTSTTNASGGTQSGQVGGTSLAAPVMNGLQAVTQSFIAAQTYPGAAPAIGFAAPVLYQLGNSGHADSYYNDIQCGNTANPTSGPDGDAATTGWDAATGWGEPDWFNFATGYALQLGATNVSVPASLSKHYAWSCAKTPSNSTERAFSCPSASTCYAVGNASGGTPWYGKFLPGGAWGAVNTFFKSTDGGQTWFPANSDMFSIACTTGSTCIEVGAGGRSRKTTDSGSTWPDVATAPNNNKPLTQVACPSSSICYAVGDRGNAMKSVDGGSTWSWLNTTDGNPLYGLSCPSTTVCYATDIYAHVMKTTDGGASWVWQTTPVTTPGTSVPGSGGPNPFAGLMAISCSSETTCVASGLYVVPSGQTIPSTDPPIVTTTDGGTTWTRQTSNAGAGNYLHSISCLLGTTTCTAVGRAGTIVTTTDLVTWTKVAASGTTSMLNSVTCLSTSFCMAVGQNGTVDTWNGSSWTATTGNGGAGMLAGVSCIDTSDCYATGKQGVTIATTDGGAHWAQQAGGGTTQQMNSVSCPSGSLCYAVGNAGTILSTANGGQTWLAQTSGTTQALNGVACVSSTTCTAVGAAGTARATTDGSTWNTGTTGTTNALFGVSCASAAACVAVGAAGTALASGDVGATWSPGTTGVAVALNAVSCPSATCFAAGAATGGAGVVIKSTNSGATWVSQTSGTPSSLGGIACVNDSSCIADGAFGTVIGTANGGANWAQQGNPLSGPTTALNVTNSAGLSLLGAACTSVRCMIGTGTQGDIMMSENGPATSAAVAPPAPDGLNGWYVTAPVVTLSATPGAAPVASTFYTINGGATQTYAGPFPVTPDGTNSVSFWSTDAHGNTGATSSISLHVDLTNPTSSASISPAEQNGWYASPSVTLTGTDGAGSGVGSIEYKIDGLGSFLAYSGPLSGFATGNHFVQFYAVDNAGRTESPVNLVAFKADSQKPTVTISRPVDGVVYQLGKVVTAAFKCADKQSGAATCVGTQSSGTNPLVSGATHLDTSTLGAHTITVTGTDKAGNVQTAVAHYTVVYTWSGFFSPISNESASKLNLVRAGDLIKIGFGLNGDRGSDVLSSVDSGLVSCPAWAPHTVPAAGAGSVAGLSYGVSSGHYTYGWQTDASWAGTCRQFKLQLNDGTPAHTAVFMFFA